MRKVNFIYPVCVFLISFAACKKDSGSGGSSNYYIKANIGGTEKNYTSTPMAIAINQSGTYSLSMNAGAGSASGEGLGFQINQTSGPITAGTYSETAGGTNYVMAGTYNPGTTDVSAIYGAGLNPAPSTPLQIVISGISDKQVSGTFSGTFYDDSGTGTNALSITNGSFNLPIQ